MVASCIALNGATSAACGTEKYKNVKCTDVKIDYEGSTVLTAVAIHTPCETAPGGPEDSFRARESHDNHVCVRTGTHLQIGQLLTTFRKLDIPAVTGDDLHVLCKSEAGKLSCNVVQ